MISGFDRLVFRGNLRSLVHEQGMKSYLWHNQVLLKEFGKHAERTSHQLKAASVEEVERLGRPVKYVKPSEDKEAIARQIVAEQKIDSGPVCVIKSVEPCWSYEIYRSREEKKLKLVKRPRQCLFLYHYQIHPVFGFMNARIQSWFPFPVQICMNGREWLSRQMDREGLEYVRQDNCFPWLANYERAQQLLQAQLRSTGRSCYKEWPRNSTRSTRRSSRNFRLSITGRPTKPNGLLTWCSAIRRPCSGCIRCWCIMA